MPQLKRACTKPDDHIIHHVFRMFTIYSGLNGQKNPTFSVWPQPFSNPCIVAFKPAF